MPYYLNNASSASAAINIPQIVIGATVGDYVEIKAVANSGNPTNAYRLFGDRLNSGFTNLVEVSSAQVTLRANSAANLVFNVGYTQPAVGEIFTLKIVKSSSTQWQAFLNGSSIGTATSSNTLIINGLFRISNTTFECFRGGIYYVAISDNGGVSATRYYDPSSTSSGTVLPDTVNSANNGNQVGTWPADNSEWVFYSSGASNYTDTLLAGSYAHSGSLLNSSVGYSSALQTGSFAHSGSVLSSVTARSSTLQAGSYGHSGSLLGSSAGYSSALQSGAFSYSGSELQSIIQNGAQNYSDTLLGGSFAHAGSALQSAIARNSTLLAGSYSHSGSNLSASLAFYSTLNGGAYSHFGSMLQSTVSGQVTVSIEGYTITFAADDVSGAFAADTVAATFINDYVSATWSN